MGLCWGRGFSLPGLSSLNPSPQPCLHLKAKPLSTSEVSAGILRRSGEAELKVGGW